MNTMNPLVQPLLTDLYQLTMCYGYWKTGIHMADSVFDLFFRKNPFDGEFTIFAGLEESLRFIENFRITEEDITYLQQGPLSSCDSEFFIWLKSLDCSHVRIYAVAEGTFVFPKIPLLRVEGPLAICQMLETTLLNLINYPSLVATNAARFRLAAGWEKNLLEFGLRRSQGPDGGISASQYCYLGGFDATSNVLAGKLLGIPVKGTHAHSFICAFMKLEDLPNRIIHDIYGQEHDLVSMVENIRNTLGFTRTNTGELAAFIAYAMAFPKAFLGLVDTYDTLRSGVPNYLCVAIALLQLGYKPLGIRLDSGDLAYFSKEACVLFHTALRKYNFENHRLSIVASNDINEETLHSLREQGHEIDVFGIGTHLVTCQKQPALGGVYKLVEINRHQRIKLSQDKSKMTIPGKKEAYRLIGKDGYPLLDIMIMVGEPTPQAGERILCRHVFEAAKRAYVVPNKVISLHKLVWDGKRTTVPVTLEESRQFVLQQLRFFREDHLRSLNPTPYKISVSDNLYNFWHNLWLEESPIDEIV